MLEIYSNPFRDGASQDQPDRVGSGYLSIAAIVHTSLNEAPEFESISYTWGSGVRTGKLHVALDDSYIALTQSLVEALPYLFSRSTTGRLWIDQLCINQEDLEERAQQVSLMGDIYKSAKATIIWLGLEDDDTAMVRAWIDGFKNFGVDDNDEWWKRSGQVEKFITDPRHVFSDIAYKKANRALINRPWFSRGWIVQEYLLSTSVSFICGPEVFTEQNLEDISWKTGWTNFNRLNELRGSFFIEKKALEHIEMMRLLCETCEYFETTEPIDKLFSLLGLWKPAKFTPDYTAKHVEVFTDFTRCMADETGCLDFLSIAGNNEDWSSDADGLPSWVPFWTETASQYPESLALRGDFEDRKAWNASKGRKHISSKPRKGIALKEEQLLVRGRIVDIVDQVFDEDINITLGTESEQKILLIKRFVNNLSSALPSLSHWTILDFLKELRDCRSGGCEPDYSPERILEDLSKGRDYILFAMFGRKFIMTETGDIALTPTRCCEGNMIAIFHGCSVPMVISKREDGSFDIVGDCFLRKIMFGQVVYWEESEAMDFVLN